MQGDEGLGRLTKTWPVGIEANYMDNEMRAGVTVVVDRKISQRNCLGD